MGLLSGLFGGGKMKQTGSSSVELPDWLEDAYKQGIGRSEDLYDAARAEAAELGQDPRTILGPNANEYAGLDVGLGGLTDAKGYLDQAGDLGVMDSILSDMGGVDANAIEGRSYADALEGWQNPYTEDVIDASRSDAEREYARRDSEASLAAARAGGIGNVRGDIANAVRGEEFSSNLDKTMAELRSGGFDKAAALAQGEMGQYLTQQQLQGNLLNNQLAGEVSRSNILEGLSQGSAAIGGGMSDLLSGFGGMERGIDQQQLDEERTNQQQQLDWLNAFETGNRPTMPSGVGTTTGQEMRPSAGQQALGIGTSLLGAWISDETVKHDIEDTSRDALSQINDLRVVDYEYDDGIGHRPDRHTGLIAQDVEDKVAGATFVGDDGKRRIDPFSYTATLTKAVQQLSKQNQPKSEKWREHN